MKNTQIVNCYCFNPLCKSTIFGSKENIAVRIPLSRILSESIHCKECNSELISKTTLELKQQIDHCLLKHTSVELKENTKEKVFTLL
ncbi:MAG: hypothetical protein JWP71_1514 [Mucilaginibacter sp.]|nr:hypothetical protein [Mucilaginibacter sp.]